MEKCSVSLVLSLWGYISDNTPVTSNSWKRWYMSHPTPDAATIAITHSGCIDLNGPEIPRTREKNQQYSILKHQHFLRSWPQGLKCQTEMITICRNVRLVVEKGAGAWTSRSLPLKVSSILDLWNPAPGSHPPPHTHTSQATCLCCVVSFQV